MPLDVRRLKSVGKSYYGVNNFILDVDSNGRGEVGTKSRNVFMGYKDEEGKTKNAFTPDDFKYKTGDIGHLDQDGFLFIEGRIKELIITAGGTRYSYKIFSVIKIRVDQIRPCLSFEKKDHPSGYYTPVSLLQEKIYLPL